MRKFILSVVITVVSIVSVHAQKTIYHKIQGEKAYYRVEEVGKATKYYKRSLVKGKATQNFEAASNKISQKNYEKINANESILRTGMPIDSSAILHDEKDITACSVMEINTSSEIEVGEKIRLLQVKEASNKELIGCDIMCQIIEKRKSNISGSEGRLTIRPLYIVNKDNQPVRLLPTDIHKRGKNRANVKFWTSIVMVPMFIAGSKAEIEQNETFELRME